MRKASLMLRTEMIFWREDGEVIKRGDYHLVRTSGNPTYYGGNLLYFDSPPANGDYDRWMSLFQSEFNDDPGVKHVLFIWDIKDGDIGAVEPFVDGGFEVQSNVTLMAREVIPPANPNIEIEVRRIQTDDEWHSVLEAKLRLRDSRFSLETYTPFKRKWLNVRRNLADRGLGNWYGAYLDDRLVADLGLFRDGNLGRFQDVGTEVEYRGRGICGTLVYQVSKCALESDGIDSLVMVADENYHAARIYESVGFIPTERHAAACRYPAKT
jgi:GNAT superfamily N-acetyltransferase